MDIWWNRLKLVSEKESVEDFLNEQNFTWKIISQPCYMKVNDEYVIIPNHQVSVRSDNLRPISVIKNRYRLLTNDECFKIADKFKKEYPNSKFVSCGDIMNQKESYISMLLDTIIINNDEFGIFLTISNGFDGRNAVNSTITIIRLKDNAVIQFHDKEHPRIFTMGRINIELKFQMVNQGIKKYIDYIKTICQSMNEEITLNDVAEKIFDIDWNKKKRVNKNIALIKEYTREIFMKNNGKTMYDFYFALSNYYCNGKRIRVNKLQDDKRFQMAMIKTFYELNDYGKKILAFLNKNY